MNICPKYFFLLLFFLTISTTKAIAQTEQKLEVSNSNMSDYGPDKMPTTAPSNSVIKTSTSTPEMVQTNIQSGSEPNLQPVSVLTPADMINLKPAFTDSQLDQLKAFVAKYDANTMYYIEYMSLFRKINTGIELRYNDSKESGFSTKEIELKMKSINTDLDMLEKELEAAKLKVEFNNKLTVSSINAEILRLKVNAAKIILLMTKIKATQQEVLTKI